MIHTKPRCFGCATVVSSADLVFTPVCGSTSEHDECGSACWHPLCLMEWREKMEQAKAVHSQIARAFAEFIRGFDQE